MSHYLLDVNVLIALHSPSHGSFREVQRWFSNEGVHKFATCATTECGFIRLSAQLSAEANVGLEEAKFALATLLKNPSHTFWTSSVAFLDATKALESRIHGHRQITDAYLLGLAIHHKGKLATLDRAIVHLAGPEFAEYVELIH